MASTSTLRASSSSSSIPRCTSDAFLSFHGKDTRNKFTDHLHYVLRQKGIKVFRDEKLERGKNVGDGLLKAIQESRYAIVVISANYASSRWCLIELAEIVECIRRTNLRVLPIFYNVNPSDVRNQTGTFAEAFARHEKNPKVDDDKLQKWRAALKEVGNISGWHVNDGPESIVVEEISRKILFGLSHNFSYVSKGLVGIKSRVKEMKKLLGMGLDDVRFLGIWGMGGIGKTTLAQVIYQRIAYKFEASCFILNVREETRKYGLLHLQKLVISQILGESYTIIQNDPCVVTNMIASQIRQRRVLIILDDMDEDEQVEKLAGSRDWFGQGSRIIITSRDLHFLKKVQVDNTYKVEELNDTKALKLFSLKAFKEPHPEENYVELSKDIVSYAQGLPLALEVFGSFLFGRKMDFWKKARDVLKEKPNVEILDLLKISFSGLDGLQQELFLDIACFFNNAFECRIMDKLESFGYDPIINIEILADKSLMTISDGQLKMHDLLQKMGQKIVHDESAEPGKRSRLCDDEDVIHVLKNDTGTDAVKGIVLKLPLKKPEQLNVEAFSKMKNLKMLEISYYRSYKELDNLCTNLEWHGDLSNFMLSNELCVMQWWGYPLEYLPNSFQSNKLVELIMRNSCIKQPWVGSKSFDKLILIELCNSQNLIETPDLSGVPNLKNLDLEGCTSLSKVHRSIGSLRRLTCLKLDGCSSLEKIPNSVGNITSLEYLFLQGTAIKKIPLSFKRLTSLDGLYISNCSRLKKIPKNLLSDMKCLYSFYAMRIGIGADLIKCLLPPNSISILGYLDLSYCNLSDEVIPSDLSCLPSLCALWLSGNKFTRIPDSVAQLSCLSTLDLDDCSCLQALPKLPLGLTWLGVTNCPSLECLYKEMEIMWRSSNEKLRSIDCSIVQVYIDSDGKPFKILRLHPRSPLWTESGKNSNWHSLVECGPPLVGSGITEWFNDKSTNSSFGTIQLHSDLGSDGWMGYAVFIVYEFHDEPHTTHPRKSRKVKVDERKGNSNSTTFDGGNPNLPIFVCHFQVDGVDLGEFVLRAPGVPSVGPNGFWAYIPREWFIMRGVGIRLLDGRGSLEASVTTSSLNVEVKECGARVLRDKHDVSQLYQLLKTISPRGSDLPRTVTLYAKGPIINKSKVVASGSIGSVNCQHLLKKSGRRKIRLIGNRLTGIKGKQKTLTFPSQWIRGEPTKKRRRKAHE